MASGMNYYSGSFVGTGSSLDVKLPGFQPKYVKLRTSVIELEWWEGMPAASGLKSVNHDSTQLSLVTSNGITPLADGFTIGTDSVNGSGTVCYFLALA